MDKSCEQMIGEVRKRIPCKPGQPERIDEEYVRNGVAEIFMEVEPLAGKRHVSVTEHRNRKEWALPLMLEGHRFFSYRLIDTSDRDGHLLKIAFCLASLDLEVF